jgi:ariadne-1
MSLSRLPLNNYKKADKQILNFNKNFLKPNKLVNDLIIKQIWLVYVETENALEIKDENILIAFLYQFLRNTQYNILLKENESKNPKEKEKEKKYLLWEEVARLFLNELDPKALGVLSYEQFSLVFRKDWTDFIKGVISQGSEHRTLLLRLREELKKKNVNPKKHKKKKKISKEEVRETNEIDKLWEEHLEEEEREMQIEREAMSSMALSTEKISNLRNEQIREVSEILDIKPYIAEALLDRVKWNQDKLMTEYFNNQEEFIKSVGIDPSTLTSKNSNTEKIDNISVGNDEEITCSICFDDFPLSQTTTMPECSHNFCNGCWTDMLEMQIKEGHTFDIPCMFKGCFELVPPEIVEKLVSEESRLKYSRFLSKTFVDHAQHIRWCPAPGCDNAITEAVTEGRIRVATCLCGKRICWECQKEAHPPITCKLLEKFEEEAKNDEKNLGFMIDNNLDANTLKWMQDNTKQCPFCSVVVQKHNGCYCMTCKQCSQSWCWLCAEAWYPSHSNHFRCTKFNAGGSQLTNKPRHKDKDTFRSRLELERLAHYCRLYQEQTKAIQTEALPELKAQDENKIKNLKSEVETLDTSFIQNGRLILKKCREILKYSYIYTYYTPSKSKIHQVSEYLQSNLETAIERLAQALDKPPIETFPPEIRKLTKLSAQAADSLLQHQVTNNERVDKLIRPKPIKEPKKKSDKSKEKKPDISNLEPPEPQPERDPGIVV